MKARFRRLYEAIRKDPRWIFVTLLFTFSVIGQLWLGFYTTWQQALVAVLSTVTCEVVAGRLVHRQWINPISAIMTGVSISILLTVGPDRYWPYGVAAAVAIGAKYLIRYKGGHVFNPSNLGVACVVLFGPAYAVLNPSQWTNSHWPTLMILSLGGLVSYRVRRLDAVGTFLASFLVLGAVRSWLLQIPFGYAIGPVLGTEFQLFTLFMLTDPKTSPQSSRGRILYAVTVALIDAALRAARVTYSEVYALTLTCLLVPVLNHHWEWTRPVTREQPRQVERSVPA